MYCFVAVVNFVLYCVERSGVSCVSVLLLWVVQEGAFAVGWAIPVRLNDGLVLVKGRLYDLMTTQAGKYDCKVGYYIQVTCSLG